MLLEEVACDIKNTFCIGICRILDEHLRNLINLDVFIQFVVRNKQLKCILESFQFLITKWSPD